MILSEPDWDRESDGVEAAAVSIVSTPAVAVAAASGVGARAWTGSDSVVTICVDTGRESPGSSCSEFGVGRAGSSTVGDFGGDRSSMAASNIDGSGGGVTLGPRSARSVTLSTLSDPFGSCSDSERPGWSSAEGTVDSSSTTGVVVEEEPSAAASWSDKGDSGWPARPRSNGEPARTGGWAVSPNGASLLSPIWTVCSS